MTKANGQLTSTVLLLIVGGDLLNTLAELSFKQGAMAPGIDHVTFSNFSEFTVGLLSSPGIWIGIACYLVMFFLWITVLSKVDLSVAFPLQSTDYLLVPLASMIVLHERIVFLRWAGILLVMSGVYLILRSATSTRSPQR